MAFSPNIPTATKGSIPEAVQLHKKLRLPQKDNIPASPYFAAILKLHWKNIAPSPNVSPAIKMMLLMFDLPHPWNVQYNAQSIISHPPTSPDEIVGATFDRKMRYALFTHAAMQAFAASLLDQDCSNLTNIEGNDPPLSQLLAEAQPHSFILKLCFMQ